VLHSGRTIRDVAKSIGVHEITLGKWVNKAKGDDSDRDKELSETERAELERLRKENAVLRMERDFAKKVIMSAGAGTGDRMRIGVAVRS
jgi:transposase